VVVVEGYMDVVALAQHGVEYAVATLGTSTTPTHAQKLFRLTDTVVFCFDGDNAGRKAAWRALENTLPELRDGKNAVFLFLPDGEDPDDYVRRRGKAAFEQAIGKAVSLSEFLLSELVARHPPESPEGRAALVAAAKPYLAQVEAPVLAAILRKRLAVISGLADEELRDLVAVGAPAEPHRSAPSRPPARGPARRPPSLVRQLVRGLLLHPALGRNLEFPQPDDRTPDAAALGALVRHCAEAAEPPTTAAVLQAFVGTPHADVFASILGAMDEEPLDDVALESEMKEGLSRWWQQARRSGRPAPPVDEAGEEARRQQQLDYVRRRLSAADHPDGRAPEVPS